MLSTLLAASLAKLAFLAPAFAKRENALAKTDETTELRVLRRARALLDAGWARGGWAYDELGEDVSISSDRAVSFCIDGALVRAQIDLGLLRRAPRYRAPLRCYENRAYQLAARAVLRASGREVCEAWHVEPSDLYRVNDSKSLKRDVLLVVDKAIRQLENA